MRRSLLLCALAGLILLISDADAANEKTKCLIEFGWDEPDTAFLRARIQQMERSPFDGCVFHADYALTGTNKGSFSWQAWGTQAFTEADLKDAFADLHATHLGRFKQNFLRFNTTPAKLDWFDDYSAIVTNARLAGRLARAGNCSGILFDIEQYEGPLFNYRKQRDSETKSWELYADQVRRRGREVMQAFQEGYPNLTVFLTFGYSLPWAQSRDGKKNLADCDYGLLAPFLDGMVETTQGHTRLVDGYERAYGYKTAREFEAARKGMKENLLPIVRDPEKYQRVFSLGFGIWLDKDWRKRAWNTEDLSQNYFSPEAFAASMEEAFRTSDEYVWVYSETPRWWSTEGTPVKLPLPYDQALRRARQRMEALRGR